MKKSKQDKILFSVFVLGLLLSFSELESKRPEDVFMLVLLLCLSYWISFK